MFWGAPSKIVMKWDTPDECMETIKIMYPNAEIVKAKKSEGDDENV